MLLSHERKKLEEQGMGSRASKVGLCCMLSCAST